VQRQTYSYLPGHGASLSFGWYQIIVLLGEQRHMCVNNLPRVVTLQWSSQELNLQPLGLKSNTLTIYLLSTVCSELLIRRKNDTIWAKYM